MNAELLEALREIDLDILHQVVQQDQRSAIFEITKCSVSRLSDKGNINPDGLWSFSGQAADRAGARALSVFLKILKHPEEEPLPNDLLYWKREFLLASSQWFRELSGPMCAPRFYWAEETA